jgi:hypothetical protein
MNNTNVIQQPQNMYHPPNVAQRPPKVTRPVHVLKPVAVAGHVNPVEVPVASQNVGDAI